MLNVPVASLPLCADPDLLVPPPLVVVTSDPRLDQIVDAIDREGQGVKLYRDVDEVPLDIQAKIRTFKAQEIIGAIQHNDREARLAGPTLDAANWPGPPRRNDLLVDASDCEYTVVSVEVRFLCDTPALYILHLRGDG